MLKDFNKVRGPCSYGVGNKVIGPCSYGVGIVSMGTNFVLTGIVTIVHKRNHKNSTYQSRFLLRFSARWVEVAAEASTSFSVTSLVVME